MASPRTPSPDHMASDGYRNATQSPVLSQNAIDSQDYPLGRDTMTPPPSTQPARLNGKSTQNRAMSVAANPLASPPATIKIGPPITSAGLYGEVPSLDSVQQMDETQLRALVAELLPALGEARVTAAHSKLQHSLLAIEKDEAAKRAEVEHEATRREVQVLQDNSPTQHQGLSPQSPHGSLQRSLQLALAHCRELQGDNVMLEKRLRSSKRLIIQLDSENAELKERNQQLRQRIKANREHLNEMQSSGAISLNGTPMTDYGTPQTRHTPRTPATGRPVRDLDALLMAGQMLNGEATSVPSTPTPTKPRSNATTYHVRGAHSLSSLPSTPSRSRPVTADVNYISPLDQSIRSNNRVNFSIADTFATYEEVGRNRSDRDSTISMSDNEEDPYREDDITGSQASQRATTMLRRSLGSNNEGVSTPAANSGKLLQGRLIGQVKKPGLANNDVPSKRAGELPPHEDMPRSNKKAKMTISQERVGLGIKDWSHVEP